MLLTEFKAYGKVNLYLSVGDKRSDGFHSIETVMHRAPIFDTVRIETVPRRGIELICSEPSLLAENDLTSRAVRALHEACGRPLDTLGYGYRITLEKHIPLSGGMGGGSADAGATLRELNRALGSPLGIEQLAALAARLGSDVPFFTYDCEAMLALGRGERLTPCPSLPKHRMEFASCGKKPSTAAAYAALDELRETEGQRLTERPTLDSMLEALGRQDLDDICRLTYNSFEDVLLADKDSTLRQIKADMRSRGAKAAFLCGSGPTVCAIFEG